MTSTQKQAGFSAIELLITLFVAVGFFAAGFQIYNLIKTDSDDVKTKSIANNIVSDYLDRYKPTAGTVCSTSSPLNNEAITVSGLINTTISVYLGCNKVSGSYFWEETIILSYGAPQKTIQNGVTVSAKAPDCPTGFIVVPGSANYGTSDFCVMKYEAKNDGNGIPVSTASGTPWASISESSALSYSSMVSGCSDCHLITEAEWLTIAQNVASVPDNWSSGNIGIGYIYSGHTDNTPASTLAASTNDLDGYNGTGQTSGNQKRTLTLTNGEVIWDFAGNVNEFTDSNYAGGQPGITGETAYAYKEWTAVTFAGSLSINPAPSVTNLNKSSTWSSTNGIGKIFTKAGTTGYVIARGGSYVSGSVAGIYCMFMHLGSSGLAGDIGFRVTR